MATHKYKASIMIDELTADLKNLQKEAASADKVMSMIGNKGNLNRLLVHFLNLSNMIDELRQNADDLKSTFAGDMKGGFFAKLNDEFGNLAELLKQTKDMTKNILDIDLSDSNAKNQLKELAKQMNAIMESAGANKKINFELFDMQSLQEQRNELLKYIQDIGSQITLSIGKMNLGTGSGRGSGNPVKRFTAEVQTEIDKLEKEIASLSKLQNELSDILNAKKDYDNFNLIENIDVEETQEFANKIITEYRRLVQAKEDLLDSEDAYNDDGSYTEQYYRNLMQRSKALLQMARLQDNDDLDMPRDLKDFVANDLEDTLDEFQEEAKNINHTFDNILTSKRDILQTLKESGEVVEDVGAGIVDKVTQVQNLAHQLEKLFKNINSMSGTLEYKVLINGQEIDIKQGGAKGVSTQNAIESYLGTLNKNSIISAHNHPGGASSNFNAVDFRSTMDDVYGGVAQLGAIVSEKDITTLNLAGVAFEDALKVLTQIDAMNVESISADKINELFAVLNPDYQNIAQVWEPSQFEKLADFIYEIGASSNAAIDPLTKFQNILKVVTHGNIDLSKYESLLSDFKVEEAGSIFNKIMDKEGIDLRVNDLGVSSLNDFVNDINKQKEAFVQLRNEADVTYSYINDLVKDYLNTGGINSQMDGFVKQYFDRQDTSKISEWLIELENGEATINQITNRIAEHFQQIDPSEYIKDDFSNVSDGLTRAEGTVVDASEKVKAFLELTERIKDLEFGADGAYDNVEIGKYIERLSAAKQELDELADSGKIAAEDIAAVNAAFGDAERKLLNERVGYTGYGDYSYSYAPELYAEEQKTKELSDELEKVKQELERVNQELDSANYFADEIGQRAINEEFRADKEKNRADILEQQNEELREQLELQNQLAAQSDNDEELTDIQRENGSLEDRLEILREIAYEYGVQIDQRKRNRYEELVDKDNEDGLTSREQDRFDELSETIQEADEKLLEFEETYERIVITLSNGKKLEILPDDKGLRDLYKIDDEYGTYNGFEIEDVQFIRKELEATGEILSTAIPQAAQQAEAALSEIRQEQATLFETPGGQVTLFDGMLDDVNRVDAEVDELKSSIKEVAVLDGQLSLFDNYHASTLTSDNVQPTGYDEAAISEEIQRLTVLQDKLNEVKIAIQAKTKAFYDEGVVAGQAIGKEIAALTKLEEMVDAITPKVNSLIVAFKSIDKQSKEAIKDNKSDNTDVPKKKSAEDEFKENKDSQIKSLNEYRKSLENVDYVSAELREELQKLADDLDNVSTPIGLDAFKKDLADLKREVEASKNAFNATNFGYINSAESKLKNAFNKLNLDQRLELQVDFEQAFAELEQYKLNVKDGKKVELDAINTVIAALQQKIDTYQQVNKEAENAKKQADKNIKFGSTAEINATGKYNSLKNKAGSQEFANSKVVQEMWKQYEEAYNRVLEKRKELAAQPDISDEDKANFKELTKECNAYGNALNKLIDDSRKLIANDANGAAYALGADFTDDAQGRKAALTEFIGQLDGVDAATVKFKDSFTKCIYTVNNGDGTFTKMTATFDDARTSIVQLAGDTQKAVGAFSQFISELKGKFRSITQYLVATLSIHDVIRQVKQGIQYIREIDAALTELKKVTDETDSSYDKFLQSMSKTAGVVGSTVSELTTMAAEWARLGYSMEEAGKLAESTAILLNVSEFEDATSASEALISTMQAFSYTADESQHVVDILNEVGNNFAVSSDGIATALQDSASALMEGGNSLEQAVALVASANRVVQDPNSVGK